MFANASTRLLSRRPGLRPQAPPGRAYTLSLGIERLVPSNGTIWLVPDKSVRQFHHADFGAAAKLNLGVVADPFHLRNKQHVYVNVARFTTAREKRRKYPTFHLTILNVARRLYAVSTLPAKTDMRIASFVKRLEHR